MKDKRERFSKEGEPKTARVTAMTFRMRKGREVIEGGGGRFTKKRKGQSRIPRGDCWTSFAFVTERVVNVAVEGT